MNNISIKKSLTWATKEFEKQNIDTAQLDAEVLLAYVLNCARIEIYLRKEEELDASSLDFFKSLVARRVRREPIAYIVGYKEFWKSKIKVTPDVLIPRPETEGIIELALKLNDQNSWPAKINFLDLCTGSGCLAAALSTEFPHAQIYVSDISEKALALAKENLAFAGQRVSFLNGNLFEAFNDVRRTKDERLLFDLIVSNPPYVSETELKGLADDITKYEPIQALVAESEGLAISKKILEEAWNYLKPGAVLIMEIGIGQASDLKEYAQALGRYDSIKIYTDLAGIERYLVVINKMKDTKYKIQ